MGVFMHGIPNRFLLPKPSAAWEKTVSAYDPDLRVFPSQTRNEYRVARVRKLIPIDHRQYANPMRRGQLQPDTLIALDHNLIFIQWGLSTDAIRLDVDGKLLVDTLRRRDTETLTKKLGSESDATADRIEELEANEQAATDRAFRDKTRQIGRAARLSVLYRTGQRVSLHIPAKPAFLRGLPDPAVPSATTPTGLVERSAP